MSNQRQLTTFDWPKETGNNYNTFSTNSTIPINISEKYNPIIKAYLPCIIINNTLYGVDKVNAHILYAVDLTTNTLKWQFTGEDSTLSISSIISTAGIIYFRMGFKMYAIEDTGASYALRWTLDVGTNQFNYDETSIFYTTSTPNVQTPTVVSVDAKTGVEKFRVNVGADRDGIGPITVGGGRLYFFMMNQFTGMYTQLYCISAVSGIVQWTTYLGTYGIVSSHIPAYSDEKIFIDFQPPSSTVGTLYLIISFNAKTGSTLWKYNLKDMFTSMFNNRFTVSSDAVITMISTGHLVSINKNTGVENWRVLYAEAVSPSGTFDTRIDGLVIAADKTIILENHKMIKMFNATTGALIRKIIFYDVYYTPVAVASGSLILKNSQNLIMYSLPQPGSDITKPVASLDSFTAPRFSPYEPNFNITKANTWLSEDSYTQAEIFMVGGQIVRHIDYGLLNMSWNALSWNGLNDQGKPVPYGKYYFSIIVKDLNGNVARYDFPNIIVTVGDIIGTTLKDVNLRSGPGTQYNIITVAPKGSLVRILDDAGDWDNVAYQNTPSAYIAKYLISAYSNTAQPTTITYTVLSGDYLYKIAIKYGITVNDIINANSGLNPNLIYIGQKLIIPTTITYIVLSGDTLYKIAIKYGITVTDIINANPGLNPNLIYIGQKLVIPSKSRSTERIIHTLAPWDTLWGLSQIYNVPIIDIIRNNYLTPTSILYIGQEIIIR